MTDRDKVTIVINDLIAYKNSQDVEKTINWILRFANRTKELPLDIVNNWVVCAEMQPDEEGTYSIKNKYELTGEYHKFGKWAGKWTFYDVHGYESEIDVSEWKMI